jgi:hypothetical protein
MSRFEPGQWDFDNERFIQIRQNLINVAPELEEFFAGVVRDDHDWLCWDKVNNLATILALTL